MPSPSPLRLISWNITIRCPLQCRHCYSDSGEQESPDLLTTHEAYQVLDQIQTLGTPLVILSGGEPMMREDLLEIAGYGSRLGLRMALGTSGYLLDESRATQLKDAGILSVAISLDSADSKRHNTYRGRDDAFERAVRAITACIQQGIKVQINMTLLTPDITEIERIVTLGSSLGVSDYQLFIPVPTGRSMHEHHEQSETYEKIIGQVLRQYAGSSIHLRPTCIPQFRRIATNLGIVNPAWGKGCIAGISYCRIYANGDVTPCPYLPAIAGNVREQHLGEIWNSSEIFHSLRNPDLLQGKCGQCEYKRICGGCRARVFSRDGRIPHSCGTLVTPGNIEGELCGEDPICPYIPGGEA